MESGRRGSESRWGKNEDENFSREKRQGRAEFGRGEEGRHEKERSKEGHPNFGRQELSRENRQEAYGGEHEGYERGRYQGRQKEGFNEDYEEGNYRGEQARGHQSEDLSRQELSQRSEEEFQWGQRSSKGQPEEDIGRVSGRRGYQSFGQDYDRKEEQLKHHKRAGSADQDFGEEDEDLE